MKKLLLTLIACALLASCASQPERVVETRVVYEKCACVAPNNEIAGLTPFALNSFGYVPPLKLFDVGIFSFGFLSPTNVSDPFNLFSKPNYGLGFWTNNLFTKDLAPVYELE